MFKLKDKKLKQKGRSINELKDINEVLHSKMNNILNNPLLLEIEKQRRSLKKKILVRKRNESVKILENWYWICILIIFTTNKDEPSLIDIKNTLEYA